MKKDYVKPALYFESFALTQTIARACGTYTTDTLGKSTHHDERTCVWQQDDDPTNNIFIRSINTNCKVGPKNEGSTFIYETFCYNNPEPTTALFSST